MTATTASLHRKVQYLTSLIGHKSTGTAEREAAERALGRIRAQLTATAADEAQTWEPWFKGAKYEQTSSLSANGELTRLIRADLKLAFKAGRATGTGTGLAIAGDPFTALPPTIGFSVRVRHYGSFTVDITGIPKDWGYQWDDSPRYAYCGGAWVPTRALARLSAAIHDIANAYNYDNSDLQAADPIYVNRYWLNIRDGAELHSLPSDFKEWQYS